MASTDTSTITDHELAQIERANASGLPPVAFVHGLWLLPSSWDRWVTLFEEAGFTAVAPGWPDDPETVEEAKAHPEVFAHKSVGQIADYVDGIISRLDKKPAVIGHSFGGLLVQILSGRGLAVRRRCDRPGAVPRRAAAADLGAASRRRRCSRTRRTATRAVPLTYEQFRYGFANAVDEDEAKELYETYAVPGSGVPLFQAASANLNPWTEAKVDTKNPERGPLLIICGAEGQHGPAGDRQGRVQAAAAAQRGRDGVSWRSRDAATRSMIDSGWRDVADAALAFVQRFVS